MLGRVIDVASVSALRRLTRARDDEWSPVIRSGQVEKDFVGHLEWWAWDGITTIPQDPILGVVQRRKVSVRFHNLCERFGKDRVVAAIRERAKRRLGRQQVLTP